MKINIEFDTREIEAVRQIIEDYKDHSIVKEREQRNVIAAPSTDFASVDDNAMWHAHLLCLLTSKQGSAEGGFVDTFLRQPNFPLSLDICQSTTNVEQLVVGVLSSTKGIQRYNIIGGQAAANLKFLNGGAWDILREYRERLIIQRIEEPRPDHYILEREAAQWMDGLAGIGPKQSRNFWQYLGLLRYEFVIDSRMATWLREHLLTPLPMPISASGNLLGNWDYYCMLNDMLRELCLQAKVIPCIFDAAVFANAEPKKSQVS